LLQFKRNPQWYLGIASDISNITSTHFAKLFAIEKGGLDLWNAYFKRKIIYIQLSTNQYKETAKRLGRMILHDLMTVCGKIHAQVDDDKKQLFPIIIDEFESFAVEAFPEFLATARSAKMPITISHQSLGDLERFNAAFTSQIQVNTDNKFFLRTDHPQTLEYIIRTIGTQVSYKKTLQTMDDLISQRETGLGSIREVDIFKISPNVMRSLALGQALVYTRRPLNFDIVQLDRIRPKTSPRKQKQIINDMTSVVMNNLIPKKDK